MASASPSESVGVFCRVSPKPTDGKPAVEVVGNREVAAHDRFMRNFVFSRAFGPDVPLTDVHTVVVKPFIDDVIAGFSCNVFVFGETGSGKEDTLFGNQGFDDGLIPAFMRGLCIKLKNIGSECQAMVSCMNIVNEELVDVLGMPMSDDPKKLRIMEDQSRKGSVLIQGLEEKVLNVNTIPQITRQIKESFYDYDEAVARTVHQIVTVTAHVISMKPDGEQVLSGKMNFIRLSGSENISKSQGGGKPANTNLSLQVFSRVVSMLSEGSKCPPYRDSKLTRCVQDALGGKGKTNFLFTLLPDCSHLHESIFSLEFSMRAKGIQNTPEVYASVGKMFLVQRFEDEIKRILDEMEMAKNKYGIYVEQSNYERQNERMKELGEEIVRLQSELRNVVGHVQFLKCGKEEAEEKIAKEEEKIQKLEEKIEEESTFVARAEAKVEKVQTQMKSAVEQGKGVLADLERVQQRLDRDMAVRNRHLEGVAKIKDTSKRMQTLRSKTEENAVYVNRLWTSLPDLSGTGKFSEVIMARLAKMTEHQMVADALMEQLSQWMSQGATAFEELANATTDADKARIAHTLNVCTTMGKTVEESLLSTMGLVSRSGRDVELLCASALIQVKEVGEEIKTGLKMRKEFEKDCVLGAIETEGKTQRECSKELESIVDEVTLKYEEAGIGNKQLLEILDKNKAATDESIQFLTRFVEASCPITEDAGVSRQDVQAREAEFVLKAAEVQGKRKGAVKKVEELCDAVVDKAKQTAIEGKKVLKDSEPAVDAEIKKLESQHVALVKQQSEQTQQFVSLAAELGEKGKTAHKEMIEKATTLTKATEDEVTEASEMLKNELEDYTLSTEDAIGKTTAGVILIKGDAEKVLRSVEDVQEKFEIEPISGATPFRRSIRLQSEFDDLTPKNRILEEVRSARPKETPAAAAAPAGDKENLPDASGAAARDRPAETPTKPRRVENKNDRKRFGPIKK